MPSSLLTISAVGVPPYSVRGLVSGIKPLGQSKQVRRTVNGAALDTSDSVMRQWAFTFQCKDQQAPGFWESWPGAVFTVALPMELAYLTATGAATRAVAATRTEGDYTFYRPSVSAIVTDWSGEFDEWNADYSWTLDMEEVSAP